MAVFAYRGLQVSNGKQVSGVRDSDNAKTLRAALKREGVLLTEASEEKTGKKRGRSVGFGAFFGRVSVGDTAMMTRQLATLVAAGIPLVESVAALTEQVEKEELKKVLSIVRDNLNEGTSLAKALEPHGHIFPPLYVNMVAAGEASGTLEQVLERLADFMEGQSRLRGKVTGALAYPILMLGMGTLLMTMMMIVVVPKVTNIYATLDRALPWYTALLIFVSNALSSNEMLGFITAMAGLIFTRKALAPGAKKTLWTVLAIMAACVIVLSFFFVASKASFAIGLGIGLVAGFAAARFVAFLGTPAGQLWSDGQKLKLPLFGPVFRMLAVSRFSRTLATLLKSGVPLLKAMEIVRHVLDNAKLSKIVEEASGSIREGESIAGPLKRSGEFPPIVVHMIAVGEKSGQLEQMLENVARAYDAQVETRVQAMTSLLEPLIIVFMGGGVGFIAFSILMPLIQMNDFVQ
ncbi:General secretion pathway protein F [Labilithrix luteola]|uniref:General secretion pathway protein F n=1 Tax=Labilithrix luteola TaxID=1391654 RepID=A0A0K1Q7C4_9BACT|nr:type II secretion system F family protein [Labilithrix luteola]AKV01295.1 General secretion pathway protein F [Labilithrix luteola]